MIHVKAALLQLRILVQVLSRASPFLRLHAFLGTLLREPGYASPNQALGLLSHHFVQVVDVLAGAAWHGLYLPDVENLGLLVYLLGHYHALS